ncbi:MULTISPECIES: hypothetical protein [unclassified Clostridium]|uniref:hypothetical protein n=1 Tax=unclassified Clostridium TaxID=2614128 RepID=UPI0002975AF9|nr:MULTISPECIES: hypothetical protein [unclassified Clostridium]EKQ50288.1 MAG: hypothetical protein A370_05734 [Clostridium sp. Maddingley MBC34-26]
MGSNRAWNKNEINFLKENWGMKSIKCLAVNLNRTDVAIVIKAQKIGLGSFIQSGEQLTFRQLLSALGLESSYSWMKEKFVSNGLPTVTKIVKTKRVLKVDLDQFWKWAEKHKQLLNFSKFEEGTLGEEPSWVSEKRKADKSNPTKRTHNKPWTKSEDSLLIEKTKSCRYTYKDLAKEFNRTECAIKRRLYDLAVPYRPVPLDNQIKWTSEENALMIELHNKGYDNYAIAQILNKTHLSISDRLKKVNI